MADQPLEEDDMLNETWLPARDVTLITLGAFLLVLLVGALA